jgi:hypothetical protein
VQNGVQRMQRQGAETGCRDRVQRQGAETGCRDRVHRLKGGKNRLAPMLGFVGYLNFYRDPAAFANFVSLIGLARYEKHF